MRTHGRLVACLALIVASCAPAPHLAVAPGILSQSWGIEGTATNGVARADFWHAFGSPELERLIGTALSQNPALDAARARVDRARAEMRTANATRLPTVEASLNGEAAHNQNRASPVYTYNGVSGGLDISYDLDLFGANAAARRAGRERALGARFDAEAVALVIQADVARTVVQLAAIDDRIALASRQWTAANELKHLIDLRRREGAANSVDVDRQTNQLAQIAAFRAGLMEQRRHMLTALALLIGAEPPAFPAPGVKLSDLKRPDLDPGQPSLLIVRRPDIRAAEARIAAARGDVDAARRAFLPSLKLTASAMGSAAGFLGPIGLTTNAGASLLAPIFEGGRLRGQLEAASAGQRESVALYRQALLQALGEATDALSSTMLAGEREDSMEAALAAAQRNLRRADKQYRAGEVDLTSVIAARNDAFAAEDFHLIARQDHLLAVIDLFRATGGAPDLADPSSNAAQIAMPENDRSDDKTGRLAAAANDRVRPKAR